jgi:hypothetical protein
MSEVREVSGEGHAYSVERRSMYRTQNVWLEAHKRKVQPSLWSDGVSRQIKALIGFYR